MVSYWIYLPTIISLVYSKSLQASEKEAVWNNFKLHNVFLKWRIGDQNSTGVVFRAEQKELKNPLVLIEVGRHRMLSTTLPLSDGNSVVHSTQLPYSSYPIDIILVISDELIIATTKCQKLLQTKLSNVYLKLTTPEIFVDPIFKIEMGSGNPLPNFCSVLKKPYFFSTMETLENQKRTEEATTTRGDFEISCKHEGQVFYPGERRNGEGCVECVCNAEGTFDCSAKGCAPLPNCSFPLHEEDVCCPTRCARNCEFNGLIHQHSTVFWPELCVRCECNDGSVHCKFKHEHMCPPLPCPEKYQKQEEGQCCPSCVDFDFCSVKPCHEDAICSNSPDAAKCRCKEGFFGNGTQCYDIDECRFDAAAQEQLGGCRGSVCVNTNGSFRCDCLPGHPRIDERTCLSLIRI